jgi:phenylacetate-CoA ligase
MGFKLFDWSLKLKGFPMKESNLEFEHILAIPASEYADYIEKKKEEIVKFHLKNNSYYLNFFNKIVLFDFH